MKVLFFDLHSTICRFKDSDRTEHQLKIIESFWDSFVADYKKCCEECEVKYKAEINKDLPTMDEFQAKFMIEYQVYSSGSETKHVATDTPLLNCFVNTMIMNHWFWFGKDFDINSPSDHQLKQLTVGKIDKHLKEHYVIDREDIAVRSLVQKKLVGLKTQGITLCVLCQTDFHFDATMMLQSIGVFECFDDFILYEDKLEHQLLNEEIMKYEVKGIKCYEMAIVSSNINRDITVGYNCAIRTVLFCEDIQADDYMGIDVLKPDFDLLNHEQWESLLPLMDRDTQFINKQLEENKLGLSTDWRSLKSELPSQHMINVGVCIKYSKKPTTDMNLNGLFEHSETVNFKNVCLEVDLDSQGPLDAIVCKVVDLYKDMYKENSTNVLETLTKYCQENNIVLMDDPESMKNLFFRKTIHDNCVKALETTMVKELSTEHDQVARRPKTILIKASENTGKEYIQKLFEEEKLDYPVVIKTNKSFNTKFSHSKYFIQSSEGFSELYQNEDILKEDLVAEELVPHDEKILLKFHVIGDQVLFWRIDNSIPLSYLDSNTHIIKKTDIASFVRSDQSLCSTITEDLEGESRFDIKYFQKVIPILVKQFNATIAGFDFVISSQDGSYVLVDVNYFPLLKNCGRDSVKLNLNAYIEKVVKENSEKNK